MGEYQHNNPWAEKLLQVSLPDSGEAWQAMESRLDQQMPQWRNRDRRRWVLLILLLLLLIGVCNCPGSRRLFHNSTTLVHEPAAREPAASLPTSATPAPPQRAPNTPTSAAPDTSTPAPTAPTTTAQGATTEIIPGPTAPARRAVPGKGTAGQPPVTGPTVSSTSARPSPPARSSAATKYPDAFSGVKSLHPHHNRQRRQKNTADTSVGGGSMTVDEPATHDTPAGNPIQPPPPVKDSAVKKGKPVPAKTPVPPKQNEQKEKENGLMAAIGLNQFFPLGGQQSVYSSDGTSGTLSDYIPVPVLRYYFNRKLYIQLEAQINTPQATKKNLVISSPPPDTSTVQGQRIESSASLRQLFYFNVPLSIHYTLFDNFDIGGGLQFSRLTNAIGAFDTTTTIVNGPNNTVNTNAVKSFKGDALYQQIKTNEFRFLLDISYTYKHFIGGLRYNQALSKFVDIQVVPGQTTQGRNSSLQLYLRYILWDGRKKRQPPAN